MNNNSNNNNNNKINNVYAAKMSKKYVQINMNK